MASSVVAAFAVVGVNEPRVDALTVGNGSCVQTVNAVAGVTVTATETTCLVQFTQPGPNSWAAPVGVSSVKLLVVGGGGGGGKDGGGGGGGGGVYESLSHAVTSGSAVSVAVGAGGQGATCYLNCGEWSPDVQGENGVNGEASSFGAITAGGGGGGGGVARTGSNDSLFGQTANAFGGGGGGGARNSSGTTGWPNQTAVQTVFAGGMGCSDFCNGGDSNNIGRGGGGGGVLPASGVSSSLDTSTNSKGGQGGAGRLCSSLWCGAALFGSGGGGGAYDSSTASSGGTGAGAGGTNAACAATGSANTGGGGGGGGNGNLCSVGAGAAGGSGVVIISYVIPVPESPTTVVEESPTTSVSVTTSTSTPAASVATTTTTTTTTTTAPTVLATTTIAAPTFTTTTVAIDAKRTATSNTEPPPEIVLNRTNPNNPITAADGSLIELTRGETLALIGGREVQVKKAVESRVITLDLGPVDVAIGAKGSFGLPSWPTGDGDLIVPAGRPILLKGSGLKPGSRISVFMFSKPKNLGDIEVNNRGEFNGSVMVPRTSDDGEHTLQINGSLSNGSTVSSNLGFEIEDEEEKKIEAEVMAALEQCNGESDFRACSEEVGIALGQEADALEKSSNNNDKSRAQKLRNRLAKHKKALDAEREADRERRKIEAEEPANSGREMVTICHATGSASNPYVNIVVSAASLKGGNHGGHIDDIIPQVKGFKGINWPSKKSVYLDLCGGYVDSLSSTATTTTTVQPRLSTTSSTSTTTTTVPPTTSTTTSTTSTTSTSTSTSTTTTTVPPTTSTTTAVSTTEVIFRTRVVDVLDVIDEYLKDSGDLHDEVLEDTAKELAPPEDTPTSTSTLVSSSTSVVQSQGVEQQTPVTAAVLKSGIERVEEVIELLDPAVGAKQRTAVVQVAARMAVLHEANMELLSAEREDRDFPWWIILLLVGAGLGWIVVWRRRWVSIDVDACTACGTCTTQAPDFFMGDPTDGRAYVVARDKDDVPKVCHRIRLPRSRASRKLLRDMVTACETDAIKVTVRRRDDDQRAPAR